MKKVLICDDEPGLLVMYKRFLERLVPGVEFLTFPKAAPLDLIDDSVVAIITDGDMPGLSGGEFARAARAKGYNGFIFLLTSDVVKYAPYERDVTELILKDPSKTASIMRGCAELIKAVLQVTF